MSRPRISSFFSATFTLPKIVSASSTSSVGGSSVIDRKIAAGVEFTVMNGAWTVSCNTSSSRDFPHAFVGATIASRGACCHAGCRCDAAIHNVIASNASGLGATTYRATADRSSSSNPAPSPTGWSPTGRSGPQVWSAGPRLGPPVPSGRSAAAWSEPAGPPASSPPVR
ncbi:exported hypothetical protein [Actinacidiphila cocklensis]|uniref:Uncharacterized protein n=1 Tax=Actinacidiphila cocklensis TaxID=887465 RepID=A0A9W4GVQ9_9ACTN|nr:exported hypothetical protein [Actinacidiphila cocklensis]